MVCVKLQNQDLKEKSFDKIAMSAYVCLHNRTQNCPGTMSQDNVPGQCPLTMSIQKQEMSTMKMSPKSRKSIIRQSSYKTITRKKVFFGFSSKSRPPKLFLRPVSSSGFKQEATNSIPKLMSTNSTFKAKRAAQVHLFHTLSAPFPHLQNEPLSFQKQSEPHKYTFSTPSKRAANLKPSSR